MVFGVPKCFVSIAQGPPPKADPGLDIDHPGQHLARQRPPLPGGLLAIPDARGPTSARFRQPAPPREDSKNSGKINQRRMMGVRRALESAGVKFIRKGRGLFLRAFIG